MNQPTIPTNTSLIVRLPNWVGDVVMALPALKAMQESGIKLTLLGKPWVSDLLAATEMHICPLTTHFWQSRKKIAAIKNSDNALLLTNSLSSALMTYFSGKAAIGYKTNGRQCLLKNAVSKPPNLHEVEYFWDIAGVACQYWFPKLIWPTHIPARITLPISASTIARAKQYLERAQITKPFWVLCPFAHGTGNDGKSKIWSHWRELSAELSQHQLIVCPGKNEESLCAELVPEATVLSGLNLSEYAAVLASAERVIANDSGPMHIAAAVGTTTLGIFGVSDPQRTGPWGNAYIGAEGHWPTLSEVLLEINIKKP